MHNWQIQEAKARFSELVKDAGREGPQAITSHGQPVAVVLSRTEYDRLTGMHETLLDFMRRSLLHEAQEIDFPRDPSPTRDVSL